MSQLNYYTVEDYNYADEYLLELSGIRALHPKKENCDDDFTYVVSQISEADHSCPTIVIQNSPHFHIYSIEVNIKYRFITNGHIVSTGKTPRAFLKCFRKQVEAAMANNYLHIEIYALRRANPTIWANLEIPVIGYKVFGRYGFMMYNHHQTDEFLTMMRSINSKCRYIHEIYETPNVNSKNLWYDNGFPWFGKFRLAPQTQSYKTLEECNV